MSRREITDVDRNEFASFWTKQRAAIEGRVSDATMNWFCIYTKRDNVGYDFGQLRPGKLGQWDLYYWLTDSEINCDKNEALIVSGLTAIEVVEEERRNYLREHCVDPDNSAEVAMFERHERMNPDELDNEIARLKGLLGIDPDS